jgi:3-carboxy-cis,cis-muconate cycloisomerase
MSSRAEDGAADVGLLTPVSAGTAVEGLTGDAALVDAMVQAESALLHALAECGLAPESVHAEAERLAEATVDPRRLALDAVAGGNPVIPLVELLRERVEPEHRRWVHAGATSQDVLDTALMLVAAAAARRAEADLSRLAGTLAGLADRTRSVPVVARTLTQQALPTTLGLRVAGWLAGVHDAVVAVRSCTMLPVSLSGPAGTASTYGSAGPQVVDAFAKRLGQRAPVAPWHTRRGPVLALSAALTTAVGACGKIAADVLVMSQTEVGEAREGRAGPSSSMAHKANPAQSVLVAAAGRQLPALASVLGACAAAEQERPAGAWHAEWQPLRTMLRLTGGAAERTADLVAGLELDEQAMRRNLDHLVAALGEKPSWVASQVGHVDVWIDRVLRRHEEVIG